MLCKKVEKEIPGNIIIDEIQSLADDGVKKISAIIRHSARHYHQNVRLEPFMGLTENGKKFALDMGKAIPGGYEVNFFSSYIGRCIETAYLIDKGVSCNGGKTNLNRLAEDISPFYIVDFEKTLDHVIQNDLSGFIRAWISGEIPSDVIQDAGVAAERMASFMKGSINNSDRNLLNISVTHDWNIFLIKEKILNLKIEDVGPVEYLEGVLLYQKDGDTFIKNHQCDPVKID
jgi:hypothetical protein